MNKKKFIRENFSQIENLAKKIQEEAPESSWDICFSAAFAAVKQQKREKMILRNIREYQLYVERLQKDALEKGYTVVSGKIPVAIELVPTYRTNSRGEKVLSGVALRSYAEKMGWV